MAPGNSSPNSGPECRRFFALFQQHWNAGTGLASHSKSAMDRDGRWTVQTFGDAMEWAGVSTIDPGTIQSWLDKERWPQKERKNGVLKVFFRLPKGIAADPETDRLREQMEIAWQQGQEARVRSQPASRSAEREVNAAWIAAGSPVRTPGLASLTLDEPQQGNEPDATWYVRARLRLETAEYEREDGQSVFIALRNAFLTIFASGYRVANGSLISERSHHPNFRPKGDGVEVVGPCEEGFCLNGDPLGEDQIAQIKPADDGKGEESVTVALYAFRRSFAVSLSPTPRQIDGSDVAAIERDAVLNALIAKGRKDSQGRLLLARDTMKRKKIE